jgi:hypothetical protein
MKKGATPCWWTAKLNGSFLQRQSGADVPRRVSRQAGCYSQRSDSTRIAEYAGIKVAITATKASNRMTAV